MVDPPEAIVFITGTIPPPPIGDTLNNLNLFTKSIIALTIFVIPLEIGVIIASNNH